MHWRARVPALAPFGRQSFHFPAIKKAEVKFSESVAFLAKMYLNLVSP